MSVLIKPTISSFVAIADDMAVMDGFQGRTIRVSNADLAVLDPKQHFIIFYGKAAKALSEERELKLRGFKFVFIEEYEALEKFWNNVALDIYRHSPVKTNLQTVLVEKYNWKADDCFVWGSAAESNWNLLRHYLSQTAGKLFEKPDESHRFAYVVREEVERSWWERKSEQLAEANAKYAERLSEQWAWHKANR
ncbi:hypothetical protein CQ054_04340 [Ochrobactrum sp. MYb29]|nr:hypothetical protein CQ054_04340 [Ochrobactrum sp. MYb29]